MESLPASSSRNPLHEESVGTFRVHAVLDLDGDGAQEFLLGVNFWEGWGTRVYTLSRGELYRVIEGNAGAKRRCYSNSYLASSHAFGTSLRTKLRLSAPTTSSPSP